MAQPVVLTVPADESTHARTALKAQLTESLAMRGPSALYGMDQFLRQAGAERVDESASKKLRELLLDNADDLIFRAKILARHAGRTKVTAADIRLAKDQTE